MNRENILKRKMDKLLKESDQYTFPEFLFALRYNLGLSRKQVAQEIDIHEMRLFSMEHGKNFKKVLKPEIRLLSEYYNVNTDLLMKKAQEFHDIIKTSKNQGVVAAA